MRKMIFQCFGNVLLFTVLGVGFLQPTTEVAQTENGIFARFDMFTPVLMIFPVIYIALYFILAKKYRWNVQNASELDYSDEREKIIVSESTNVAYRVLMCGLLLSLSVLGFVNVFSGFAHLDISIYATAVILMTLLLIAATISYCVKWCIEYNK